MWAAHPHEDREAQVGSYEIGDTDRGLASRHEVKALTAPTAMHRGCWEAFNDADAPPLLGVRRTAVRCCPTHRLLKLALTRVHS